MSSETQSDIYTDNIERNELSKELRVLSDFQFGFAVIKRLMTSHADIAPDLSEVWNLLIDLQINFIQKLVRNPDFSRFGMLERLSDEIGKVNAEDA